MNAELSDTCCKCREKGTHGQLFWTFWKNVKMELVHMAYKNGPIAICTGCHWEQALTYLSTAQSHLKHDCVVCKCIFLHWIKDQPPTINQWYFVIFKVSPLEKICIIFRNKISIQFG